MIEILADIQQLISKFITAMSSQNSLDSFQDSLICRATPKRSDQANQASIRSRFTILSDMNETNTFNKKGEEQSLLSKYLKDLHEEQLENQTKTTINRPQQKQYYFGNAQNKQKQQKEYEHNEPDWKRKNGKHLVISKAEEKSKLQISDNSRISQIDPQTVGIFVYKKKIDLNMPIDFQIEQKENIHRNYGQSNNSSKISRERKNDEISFGAALAATSKHKQNKTSNKFDRYN